MSAASPRLAIIPAGAVTDPNLESRDIQVLALFGRHIDKAGWCRRSQVKMSREIGCARSTVQLSIRRLVTAGWLVQRAVKAPGEIGSRDSAHEYRVVLDVPDDTPADRSAPPADRSAPPADRSAPPADPGSAPMLTTPFNEYISMKGTTGENRHQPAADFAGGPRAELEAVLDPDHADALLHYFEEIGKPLTIHTAKALARKLDTHPDPNDAADEMLLHRWTSFNAKWLEVKGADRPTDATARAEPPKALERGEPASASQNVSKRIEVSSTLEADLFARCENILGRVLPRNVNGCWWIDADVVERARRGAQS